MKTLKFCFTGLCVRNSPVTDELSAQRASNAKNVSIDDVIMLHPIILDNIIFPLAYILKFLSISS